MREYPHDLLAEKSLLGSLIVDGNAFDEIVDLKLSSEDFYHPQYGQVFDAISQLFQSDRPVDHVTLSAKLQDMGKLDSLGGKSFVIGLTEEHASSANVYHYAKIVQDKSSLRKVIRLGQKVAEKGLGLNTDVNDFLQEVNAEFFKVTTEAQRAQMYRLGTLLKTNLKDLEDTSRRAGDISGLPTGFMELDKKLLGLQPGQLVILAARPAMGKTALALNMAVNTVKASKLPAAVFSLEMLAPELSQRILQSEARVDSARIRSKNFLDTDLRKIAEAAKTLHSLPLFINDSGDTSILDIKSQCRKIKAEHNLGLVVVDYIQLMKPNPNVQREQQISEISRGLKSLAKELECPILALSQLNRSVESRPNKRPLLSDLRESGSIEQDADIVMMIYRDDYYNPDSKEKGISEIIVGKNRGGEQGTAKVMFTGAYTRFDNLAHDYQSDDDGPHASLE